MNHLRRHLGRISESHRKVHDIVEGIVPLLALERSSRVLGKRKTGIPSAHGNDKGKINGVRCNLLCQKYSRPSRRSGCRGSTSLPLTYVLQSGLPLERCTLEIARVSVTHLIEKRAHGDKPSVPTKELVRKSAVHDRVSINGIF